MAYNVYNYFKLQKRNLSLFFLINNFQKIQSGIEWVVVGIWQNA